MDHILHKKVVIVTCECPLKVGGSSKCILWVWLAISLEKDRKGINFDIASYLLGEPQKSLRKQNQINVSSNIRKHISAG